MDQQMIERIVKTVRQYKDTEQNRREVLLPTIDELLTYKQKERQEVLKAVDEIGVKREANEWGGYTKTIKRVSTDVHNFREAIAFVSMDKREAVWRSAPDFSLLLQLLPRYTPRWLDAAYNNPDALDISLGYDELMQLHELGYIKELNPGTVADKLVRSFKGDMLFQRPVTLAEHIWYIFEQKTAVGWHDEHATNRADNISLQLLACAADGRISRERLIEATLGSYLNEMDAAFRKWATSLLEAIGLTPDELLRHQDQLFLLFNTESNHAVSLVLKWLKQVATHEDFRADELLAMTTPLFYAAPKSIVTPLLALYEAMVKGRTSLGLPCCEAVAVVLMRKNEALQKRVAKFLMANNGTACTEPYLTELLPTTRDMLSMTVATHVLPDAEIADQRLCRDDNRIERPQTMDDFVFLFSRLTDMTEQWEVSLAIGSLIEWAPRMTQADVERLASLFQRAYEYRMPYAPEPQALWASLALEFGRQWKPAGKTTGRMAALFGKLGWHEPVLPMFRGVKIRPIANHYFTAPLHAHLTPVQGLLEEVLRKIRQGDTLPLLSTPTHRPAYIALPVLVERLMQYQQAGRKPFAWDLTLAVNRLVMEGEASLQGLTEEYRKLLPPGTDRATKPDDPSPTAPTGQKRLLDAGQWQLGDADLASLLMSIAPHHPESVAASIIQHYLNFTSPSNEQKRFVVRSLQFLLDAHSPLRSSAVLLVAGSLLFADATARSLAAEVWADGVLRHSFDEAHFARDVALVATTEGLTAPLSRLTKTLQDTLVNRSAPHNAALARLLDTVLQEFSTTSLKGIRQLQQLRSTL